MTSAAEQASPWLKGRTFESWREEFDRRGYLIFERVLSPAKVAEIRTALAPSRLRTNAAIGIASLAMANPSLDRPGFFALFPLIPAIAIFGMARKRGTG